MAIMHSTKTMYLWFLHGKKRKKKTSDPADEETTIERQGKMEKPEKSNV